MFLVRMSLELFRQTSSHELMIYVYATNLFRNGYNIVLSVNPHHLQIFPSLAQCINRVRNLDIVRKQRSGLLCSFCKVEIDNRIFGNLLPSIHKGALSTNARDH